MIIPFDALEQETLINVLESVVLREGTDYGANEIPLSTKVEQLLLQLKNGEALLQYSEESDSINVVPKDHLRSK